LEEYVKKLKPKSSLYLPNGVNFHHFAERSWEIPLEYSSIPRPIAVYAGAIESWFDYELIKIVAASLPRVSFVIIGPDSHGLAQHNLEPFNNIYLIGEKPYEYLPSYMKYADIGLIPFNVQDHCELISHVNPLKLYEYMASGLPVVSTDWLELRKLESPAVLCKTPHDFIKGVRQTLEKPFNKKDLVEFAKNHDWSHQFKLLSDSLERI